LTSEKFDFNNSNGETLSGKLELPEGSPKAFAVFAHCFTCSKSILAATRIPRSLTKSGIGVLRFDFTGIGNSEGDFANTNFSSNVEDLISAYHSLKERFTAPWLLIGHSLGGAAVLKAATVLPSVRAVVTIGAPSDVVHVIDNFREEIGKIEIHGETEVNLAGRRFTIKKQFLDDLKSTKVLEGVSHFDKALLVMHSPLDQTVSIEHASKIFLAAKHPKSFVSLDKSDHLIMSSKDAQYAADVIAAWFSHYIDE